ncbi:hypothetical protein BDW75DRAFT_64118 [Aspergillus navahoensis]
MWTVQRYRLQSPAKSKASNSSLHRAYLGDRHDNDYKGLSLIQIVPTMEDILSFRPEHLPESDLASWHVSDLEGLLGRNFGLLREDTVGLIRDSIHYIVKHFRKQVAGHYIPKDPRLWKPVFTGIDQLPLESLLAPSGTDEKIIFLQ